MAGASAAKVLLFSSTGEISSGGSSTGWASTGAVTKKLHGFEECDFTINTKVGVVPAVGWYGPSPIAAEQAQSAEASVSGVAVYEDIVNILNGLFTYTSQSSGPMAASSSGAWEYPFTAPVNSTQINATYPMEYGTSGQAYRINGAVFNGITLSGEAMDFWKYSLPILAKSIEAKSTGLTTGANTDRTVNPVKMADTTLYVDAFSTGTFGGTALSATLISFELALDMGRHLKHFAGSKYPGNWGDARYNATLKTVLEFTSTAQGYIDGMLGSTGAELQKHLRIQATQGSSATTKTLRFDFAGIVSEPVKLWDDRDGNMTVSLTWNGKNSTGLSSGNFLQFFLINGSSNTS